MRNETLSDIAREIRTYFQAKKRGNPEHRPWHQVLSDWADRIEAAYARDIGNASALREALKRILDIEGYGAPMIEAKCIAQKALEGQQCTPPPAQETPKSEQPGNAAAMREAAGNALWCLNWMAENTGDKPTKDHLAKPIELLTAALGASPRNCDVGTIEERLQRFEAYCSAHEPCESCPLDRPRATPSCGVHWAQMPYEEGGAE